MRNEKESKVFSCSAKPLCRVALSLFLFYEWNFICLCLLWINFYIFMNLFFVLIVALCWYLPWLVQILGIQCPSDSFLIVFFIHCLSFIFILKIVLYLYLYFNVLYCIVTVFAWSSSETWNPALVPFLLFIVISLCLSSRVSQRVFTDNRYLEKGIITTNILSVKDNQLKLWCLSWSVITILYFQNGADFVFINPSIILLHNDVFKALHTMHFRKFSTSFQLLIVHVVL